MLSAAAAALTTCSQWRAAWTDFPPAERPPSFLQRWRQKERSCGTRLVFDIDDVLTPLCSHQ
jgi:hypothetical protein